MKILPLKPSGSEHGFSLVELVAMMGVIVIVAGASFGVFTVAKSKGRAADVGQRVGEVAISIESFRQYNNGSLTGLTADSIRQAYTSSSDVTIKVCPGWSQGAAAPGKYVVYGYVPSAPGSAAALPNTRTWFVDSGVGPAVTAGSPALCPSPTVL